MSIPLLIVVSIIGYILFHAIAVGVMIQDVEPPKAVRAAGMAEAAFETLIWGTSYIYDGKVFTILVFLLGIFWIGVAVSLYKASKVGLTICLVLSILRIPTVIGALFSLFSVYKLYFTQESNDFFNGIGQKGGEHSNSSDSAVPSWQEKDRRNSLCEALLEGYRYNAKPTIPACTPANTSIPRLKNTTAGPGQARTLLELCRGRLLAGSECTSYKPNHEKSPCRKRRMSVSLLVLEKSEPKRVIEHYDGDLKSG